MHQDYKMKKLGEIVIYDINGSIILRKLEERVRSIAVNGNTRG
jgi:hypothetical protein